MKISVLGLGWYGVPLAKILQNDGHSLSGSTRSPDKIGYFTGLNISAQVLEFPHLPSKELLGSAIIVLNIPPFAEQLDWFKKWQMKKDCWIIFISSTSVCPMPESKNACLLKAQEDWVRENFQTWTILRFGGLLGAGRHPGKHLSGRKNLPGRLWPVNLLHQDDAVAFTKVVIDLKLQNQIFEVVSDEHPSREEFYVDYCQRNHLPLPEFSPEDLSKKAIITNTDFKRYYSTLTSLKKT